MNEKLIRAIVEKLTTAAVKLSNETLSLTQVRGLVEDALMLTERLAEAHNFDPYEVKDF